MGLPAAVTASPRAVSVVWDGSEADERREELLLLRLLVGERQHSGVDRRHRVHQQLIHSIRLR